MTDKWNWLDEIQRLADSYTSTPPSITELLDEFHKLVPPDKARGWADLVDNPRTSPYDKKKEQPMAANNPTVDLYDCPACKRRITGRLSVEQVAGVDPTPDNDGYISLQLKVTGLRAEAHDCTPKITR